MAGLFLGLDSSRADETGEASEQEDERKVVGHAKQGFNL
jgi:hypothetical protein